MNIKHKSLASGRWNELSLIEQMGNIAGEVERSLNWKNKNNLDYFEKARERGLELLDLTLTDPKNRSRLKELARVRECFVDYFWGFNEYNSTSESLRSYFSKFAYAARKNY